jgi:hypothetical protein
MHNKFLAHNKVLFIVRLNKNAQQTKSLSCATCAPVCNGLTAVTLCRAPSRKYTAKFAYHRAASCDAQQRRPMCPPQRRVGGAGGCCRRSLSFAVGPAGAWQRPTVAASPTCRASRRTRERSCLYLCRVVITEMHGKHLCFPVAHNKVSIPRLKSDFVMHLRS